MFNTPEGKRIADITRWHAAEIRQALHDAFNSSIIGVNSEVTFFRNLLHSVSVNLHGLRLPGIKFHCRVAETHQKPRVKVKNPKNFSCELADLLMVIKYRQGVEVLERSSIFYQVKLCDRGSRKCSIDADQLELLCDWPEFDFGLLQNGGPRTYTIHPRTLEFGSYLLMLRNPTREESVTCKSHYCHVDSYGVAPHALSVQRLGPQTVEISNFPYTMNASEAFFSHVAMETGENHIWNSPVDDLVNALYRHLGLDPDPPGEFDGFTGRPAEDEPGFAILEITVEEEEGVENLNVTIAEKMKNPVKGNVVFSEEKKKKIWASYQQVREQKLHLKQGQR